METISSNLYYAILTIGLRKGYTNDSILIGDVYETLSRLQNELIKSQDIHLSANCYESTIVLSGQKEPHLNIKFINYPRFPLEENLFKKIVLELSENLAK